MARTRRSSSRSPASSRGAVWDEVEAKATLFQAAAPTGAMSDVYQHVAGDIREYRTAIRSEPRQVGGVFAIDGRPVGLELFDSAGTFESTLGRLVESYALDAIERPRRTAPVPDGARAAEFLSRAAGAKTEFAKAVGEGQDVRPEASGLVGEALVVDGRIVHLSVLEAPAEGGRAEPASERAKRVTRRWSR